MVKYWFKLIVVKLKVVVISVCMDINFVVIVKGCWFC